MKAYTEESNKLFRKFNPFMHLGGEVLQYGYYQIFLKTGILTNDFMDFVNNGYLRGVIHKTNIKELGFNVG